LLAAAALTAHDRDATLVGLCPAGFRKKFHPETITMQEIVNQLGELLLRAIPTEILLLLLWASYILLVHKPLTRVLAERFSRTEGRVRMAQADVLAAETRTAEYENKIGEAKNAIYNVQEARRNKALETRARALTQVREQVKAQIAAARVEIAKETVAAQGRLQDESHNLAAQVIRSILKFATGNPSGESPAGRAQ